MDHVKLTTIHDWKPPASVKGIQSFLGFTNFYCKFIPMLRLSMPNSILMNLVGFFFFLYLIRLTYNSHAVPMLLFFFSHYAACTPHFIHLCAVHGYALLLHSATAVRLPHALLPFHFMAMLDAHFYLMLLGSGIF